MKKILAFLLVAIMMCTILTTTAFADGSYVVSPEYEDPDDDPDSPQTGYEAGIGVVIAVALAGGAVAYVTTRKLRQQA